MKLTGQEIEILNKLARDTKMDCWFWIDQAENGDNYIFDLEERKKLTLAKGVGLLLEGASEECLSKLTSEEFIVVVDLNCRLLNNPDYLGERKYEVVVRYGGEIKYEVYAENEESAKREAEKLFGDESDSIIASELDDIVIAEVTEIEVEDK